RIWSRSPSVRELKSSIQRPIAFSSDRSTPSPSAVDHMRLPNDQLSSSFIAEMKRDADSSTYSASTSNGGECSGRRSAKNRRNEAKPGGTSAIASASSSTLAGYKPKRTSSRSAGDQLTRSPPR